MDGKVDPSIRLEIDWGQINSLQNWIVDMELYCISDFEMGFFGSCHFIGFAVGAVLFNITNVIGRKWFLIIMVWAGTTFTYGAYFYEDQYGRYVFLILNGVCSSRALCTYVYLLEQVP